MTRFVTIVTIVTIVLTSGCARHSPEAVLLYAGDGTSSGDVAAIERILEEQHLTYTLADRRRLDEMTDDALSRYRVLIVPGGNFETLGRSLAPATSQKIRRAVERGLSYLGICAGAFFAGASPYKGLDLTGGTHLLDREGRDVRTVLNAAPEPDEVEARVRAGTTTRSNVLSRPLRLGVCGPPLDSNRARWVRPPTPRRDSANRRERPRRPRATAWIRRRSRSWGRCEWSESEP